MIEIINDFRTTVSKALSEIDPKWRNYDGLIVCGTHTPKNVEHIIEKIKHAREEGRPALLICFGHQMEAVEYARNVLGIDDSTSEEIFDASGWDYDMKGIPHFAVKRRHELKVGLHDGESYWNNFERAIEFQSPPHFVSVQYHPEYQSSKDKPHKDLVRFINLCKEYEN